MLRMVSLACMFCVTFASLSAQQHPVQWTFDSQSVGDGQYDLHLRADVEDGWYIYSQFLPSDDGPIPTRIELAVENGFHPVGLPSEEGIKIEGFDEVFGMEVRKFAGPTTFSQRIAVNGSLNAVSGSVEYMTCNETMCLPPKVVDFNIPLR